MRESEALDVAVLGGGISGLTAGFLLKQQGWNVAVFEATDRPGGAIRTSTEDGFLFELGPNTVLNNAFEIDALCDTAGILGERISAASESKRRFVVQKGKLVPLPSGPVAFLTTPLFSLGAKLRLFREPFVGRAPAAKEESIAEFTRRRLGEEFLDYAVGPFVSGVYAGDPERLSVRHATAKIYALEERYGSLIRGAVAKRKGPAPAGGLFSFPEGLETLPRALAGGLESGWRAGSRVTGLWRNGAAYAVKVSRNGQEEEKRPVRAIVCALAAGPAAPLLEALTGEFPSQLPTLPQADVAVVCLGFKRHQVAHPLDGFGFLAPALEERYVLGCLFPSSLFPGRAPPDHVALTSFVGGALNPERAAEEEEQILTKTLADLRPLLGLSGDPVIHRIQSWRPAIPQYVIGHGALKAAAESFETANPGIFISGNLLHGVSVADCIRNATNLAKRVGDFLKGELPD